MGGETHLDSGMARPNYGPQHIMSVSFATPEHQRYPKDSLPTGNGGPCRVWAALWRVVSGFSLALVAGCGSSFQEGDEAWVELSGSWVIFDEYAVVEIVAFSDDRARVELIERLPVVEGEGLRADAKRSSAARLIERLEEGRSAYVDRGALMAVEDGEKDLDAKQEIMRLVEEVVDEPEEFFSNSDPLEVESVLRLAEERELDDEVPSLALLLDLVERHSAVGEDDLRQGFSAVRESADALFERLAVDQRAYRNLLAAFEEVDKDLLDSLESFVALMSIGYILKRYGDYVSEFTKQLSLDDSLDDALEAATARLDAGESLFRLVTRDGKDKFQSLGLRELFAGLRDKLAADVGKLAVDATEAEDINSTADAEAVLAQARQLAEPFERRFDIEPVGGKTAIRLFERAARAASAHVDVAIEDREFGEAVEAVENYLDLSRNLGSLYARHENSKLRGDNAKAHADQAGKDLFVRIRPLLVEAAAERLDAESDDFDTETLAAREPRVRELVAPFEAALDEEVLSEDFFHAAQERAKLNLQRRVVRAGQVWTGAIRCGEATGYRQYRAGSNRRGVRYHDAERLNLRLEILEAGRQGTTMRFQGLLTAQNLPEDGRWRNWDSASERWRNAAKRESTQFVVLTYHPRLLTVELKYGVLDRASHIERYGESRNYVGNVDGNWQPFDAKGTLTASPPSMAGRMSRRYVDDTCTDFSLAVSGPGASASAAEGSPDRDLTASSGARPFDTTPAVREARTTSPLFGLSEQTYLGGMKSRGLKVYAMSRSGDWCGENVIFKIEADSTDVFTDGTAEFYMRRFGERINEDQFCPAARSADVLGYTDTGTEPVFTGKASAATGWEMN